MSILINKDTRVIVQGITGATGAFHTRLMLEYGTRIVGGVTPGRGGTEFQGVPVFNTLKEAVERVEKALIRRALRAAQGNKSQVAKDLQIPKTSLYNKITKYRLDREPF